MGNLLQLERAGRTRLERDGAHIGSDPSQRRGVLA
jgi:hypothetical protein